MSIDLLVTEKSIDKHFLNLKTHDMGFISDKLGYSRISWTDKDTNAHEYLKQYGLKKNLIVEEDKIGNLFFLLSGRSKRMVLAESHTDSVPNGGPYDGMSGVISAIEALVKIKESGHVPKKTLGAVAFRGEEGATAGGKPYVGSLASLGDLPNKILDNIYDNKTLKQRMNEQGFDTSFIEQKKPAYDRWHLVDHAFEVHIEQNDTLKSGQIGIVTSIRGPFRFAFDIYGRSGLNDLYASELILKLNDMALKAIDNGLDLVQTFGEVNKVNIISGSKLEQLSMTKVPGYAQVKTFTDELKFLSQEFEGIFSHSGATEMKDRADALLASCRYIQWINSRYTIRHSQINGFDPTKINVKVDIRSIDEKQRDKYVQKVVDTIEQFSRSNELRHKTYDYESSRPLKQTSKIGREYLLKNARKLGLEPIEMISGAGHDIVPIGLHDNGRIGANLLFIPGSPSHSPLEAFGVKHPDIAYGANVIMYTMLDLANK